MHANAQNQQICAVTYILCQGLTIGNFNAVTEAA